MLGIEVEKRATPSRSSELLFSGIAICVALACAAFILWANEYNPFHALTVLFQGGFGSIAGLIKTLGKFTPLLLLGVGKAVAFRAKIWNIGGPGQMAMGAIAATGIALFLPFGLPRLGHLPLIYIVGFGAGASYASICAWLRHKVGLDIVVSTLMLNYVAFWLIKYLVYHPWQGPAGFPYTEKFPESAIIPTVKGVPYPTLTIGLALTAILYIVMTRTRLGYEIKVFGDNPRAAEYAGMSPLKIILCGMIISGGLAGIAGAGEVAGVHHMLRKGVTGAGAVYTASYGYIGIIIAWLGRNRILGAAVAAFFISGLLIGAQSVQLAGYPFAVGCTVLGLILMALVGSAILTYYKIRIFFRGEGKG